MQLEKTTKGTLRFARRRRGFTMIELVVAVGLMMLLMSVVATVFNGSQTAISNAEEAIDMLQRARTLHARLSKDLSGAMVHMTQSNSGSIELAFSFEDPSTTTASTATSGNELYFIAQTIQNGQLGTWDVAYIVTQEDGKDYSQISRLNDIAKDDVYTLWDWSTNADQAAQISSPPTPIADFIAPPEDGEPVFEAHPLWEPRPDDIANNALPQYIEVDITFLGNRGNSERTRTMNYLIPIYQGK